ncbi:hypothetical protein MKZ38_010095 [Zalerion maritima]|uniref:Uncharacterized protein n=1 Tax=Zalerion maritima TaxID=339359 RepID=A0AAD5WND4_9PEZI|nr:hypothetical protein MKZ38_010095 [Zalerion maritima]
MPASARALPPATGSWGPVTSRRGAIQVCTQPSKDDQVRGLKERRKEAQPDHPSCKLCYGTVTMIMPWDVMGLIDVCFGYGAAWDPQNSPITDLALVFGNNQETSSGLPSTAEGCRVPPVGEAVDLRLPSGFGIVNQSGKSLTMPWMGHITPPPLPPPPSFAGVGLDAGLDC